ncbi:MAG: ankyrin repeat domain-containing protein [Bryobacteraceae bacterium]
MDTPTATPSMLGDQDDSPAALAIKAGDLEKLELLIAAGARLDYVSRGNYDAAIDAACTRDRSSLMPLFKRLIAANVRLDRESDYRESALRILSREGRFDAVRLLLEAGAPEWHLAWTPLIRAAAIGTLDELREAIESAATLETVDHWSRTAFQVAILSGDVAKAFLLLDGGANPDVRGRCGQPLLACAVESGSAEMLRWTIEMGAEIDAQDQFGHTPLHTAAEHGNAEAVSILLEFGADWRVSAGHETPLGATRSRVVAELLMSAGADPRDLTREARRAMLGLPEEEDLSLLKASQREFDLGRSPRFGRSNPELMQAPFWEGMIRSGVSGYSGAAKYGAGGKPPQPVWCAQRFGQSFTPLPDGRIVEIGGEHEDFYDPDFCIYNDVFVHSPGGEFRIYGYPEAIFPPTDFHTATLIGDSIYIVGSLGYMGSRGYGTTPVFRLDTRTFAIERITAAGQAPGWIHGHRAKQAGGAEIAIEGGSILHDDGKERWASNDCRYLLDVRRRRWRVAETR